MPLPVVISKLQNSMAKVQVLTAPINGTIEHNTRYWQSAQKKSPSQKGAGWGLSEDMTKHIPLVLKKLSCSRFETPISKWAVNYRRSHTVCHKTLSCHAHNHTLSHAPAFRYSLGPIIGSALGFELYSASLPLFYSSSLVPPSARAVRGSHVSYCRRRCTPPS